MVPLLKRLVNLPLFEAASGDVPLRVTVKGEALSLDATARPDPP